MHHSTEEKRTQRTQSILSSVGGEEFALVAFENVDYDVEEYDKAVRPQAQLPRKYRDNKHMNDPWPRYHSKYMQRARLREQDSQGPPIVEQHPDCKAPQHRCGESNRRCRNQICYSCLSSLLPPSHHSDVRTKTLTMQKSVPKKPDVS